MGRSHPYTQSRQEGKGKGKEKNGKAKGKAKKRRQLLKLLGARRQQTGKADASSARTQVNLNAIAILTDKIDNKNQANRGFGVGWERGDSATCSSCGWGPRQ